jgi:Domain of unknown function (DUF4413)
MIHKYNNTQSNKIINHLIHEQSIYDKIIVLLTSKLLHTNSSGSALLVITCVLDPRCKMIVVEYYYQAMHPKDYQRVIARLKACLNELFNEYLEEHSKLVQKTSDSSSQSGGYLLCLVIIIIIITYFA